MDGIELLYLLFVGLYFLLGVRRKQIAKRKKETATLTDQPVIVKPATPFQEFMAQMEEAIREANGERIEEPEERPMVVASPPPEAIPSAMPIPTARPIVSAGARDPEFHSMGSFDQERGFERAGLSLHDEHGFGLDQPFSEERFERLPRGMDETLHAHAPLAPRPRATQPATDWPTRLQDPKAAQEAFVLAQIFEGPWRPRRVKHIGHQ